MEEKKKKVFLLLPELNEDISKLCSVPSTHECYDKSSGSCILLNVYEHYRTFYCKEKATYLAMQFIQDFDELWYYAALGITDTMHCCIKKAKETNIPVKAVQPVNFRKSFSTAYKFIETFHPAHNQTNEYWKNAVDEIGKLTNNNFLNSCLLIEVFNYIETVYNGKLPKVPEDENFSEDFRLALRFAKWADKNNYVFENDGVDAKKVSQNPTSMLEALLTGFYRYHSTKQRTMELNKIKKGEK